MARKRGRRTYFDSFQNVQSERKREYSIDGVGEIYGRQQDEVQDSQKGGQHECNCGEELARGPPEAEQHGRENGAGVGHGGGFVEHSIG